MTATPEQAARRQLPIWGFVLLVIGYLVAIQTIPRLTTPNDTEYASFETTADITRGLWVTTGIGIVIVLVAVGMLRWWRPVFVDDHRLPRWVWVFPIILLVTVAAGTAYSRLADKGITFTILLLIGALAVGVSEEGMFRGLGVVAFRDAGYSEPMVALWTSVIFGLAHATNLFSEGLGAIPQVLITAVAGYFFYLTRRVSGSLLVAMVVHGLWDFGLVTCTIGDTVSLGASLFLLADIVLAVIAIATFRKVFPRQSSDAP
ncbi:CPBP family intramembrane glutamic endopeptidase [Gordonia sp. CPCC 205515]|uniref:CPBP family intramembrane glutamic endopeptidase n=1 Tax=Gordonia sp. CPCC 205515 TaxID=3140791 RepID=UPI003AF3D465